ncbi:MAG: universal stress protein [Pseudomonadota bacterium]
MSIKSILAHVDDNAQESAALKTSIELARQHGADLSGFYVLPPLVASYPAAEMGNAVLDTLPEFEWERARQAEQVFQQVMAEAGMTADWQSVESSALETLKTKACCSDLIVVGQDGGPDDITPLRARIIDAALLNTGRPVLTVPQSVNTVGKRVMLAWKATREAARALSDSMSMLQQAQHVDVVMITAPEVEEKHLTAIDVCKHLKRHGIRAEFQRLNSGTPHISDLLLDHAAERETDMLILGAYGHSMLREMVLGGITKTLIKTSPVALFLSH